MSEDGFVLGSGESAPKTVISRALGQLLRQFQATLAHENLDPLVAGFGRLDLEVI